MVVPLIYREKILGTMTAINAPEERNFTEQDAELMMAMAHQAAIALENARLYQQAMYDAEAKAMLLHEVNHRVKNNLAAIIGLLYAEQRYARTGKQGVYQRMIKELANRIQGLRRGASAPEPSGAPHQPMLFDLVHAASCG